MHLRHLHYFVAVAEQKSFTRAARKLRLAQPPLSKQIRDLEGELGVKLFNRTTRRVELTSSGSDLLPEARRILEQVHISFERFQARASGVRNRFRLGVLPTIAIEPLTNGLRAFHEVHTEVEITPIYASRRGLFNQLNDGTIDAAIIRASRFDKGLQSQLLFRETAALLMPDNHRLAGYKRVPWKELKNERLLLIKDNPEFGATFLLACRRNRAQPRLIHNAIDFYSLIWMVNADLGLCPFWTRRFRSPIETCTVRLMERDNLSMGVCLTWREDMLAPWCSELARSLRSSFENS